MPTSFFIGRKKEEDDLRSFLRDSMSRDSGGSCYISGIPGTGKTALVQYVLRNFAHGYNVYECNAMFCQDVKVWDWLAHVMHVKSRSELEMLWSSTKLSILMLDELDAFVSSASGKAMVATLFDWSTKLSSRFLLIGISNTNTSDLNVSHATCLIPFRPYTFQEMHAILRQRMQTWPIICEDSAIQLCARRIVSQSGDVRQAFQLCDIAKTAAEREQSMTIKIKHVLYAFTCSVPTSPIDVIRRLTIQQQIVVASFIDAVKIDVNQGFTLYLTKINSCHGMTPMSSYQFNDLVETLDYMGIISLKSKRGASKWHRLITLQIAKSDIRTAVEPLLRSLTSIEIQT